MENRVWKLSIYAAHTHIELELSLNISLSAISSAYVRQMAIRLQQKQLSFYIKLHLYLGHFEF